MIYATVMMMMTSRVSRLSPNELALSLVGMQHRPHTVNNNSHRVEQMDVCIADGLVVEFYCVTRIVMSMLVNFNDDCETTHFEF